MAAAIPAAIPSAMPSGTLFSARSLLWVSFALSFALLGRVEPKNWSPWDSKGVSGGPRKSAKIDSKLTAQTQNYEKRRKIDKKPPLVTPVSARTTFLADFWLPEGLPKSQKKAKTTITISTVRLHERALVTEACRRVSRKPHGVILEAFREPPGPVFNGF